MKIIHIIPFAFDYFTDMRDRAMSLVESERNAGVEAEAYTLQYGPVSSHQKQGAAEKAPSLGFLSMNSSAGLVNDLNNYDIVHLHAPFLGMAGHVLKWKRNNPARPFVITYWRDVRISDSLSVFIALYNRYYLPRFFSLSEAVVFHGSASEKSTTAGRRMAGKIHCDFLIGQSFLEADEQNIHLTMPPDKIKLTQVDMEAQACISIYNKLIN